jgi:hypothetical protein
MISYKKFKGKRIKTQHGPAVVQSVMGIYGTLAYEKVDGVGWVDLSGSVDVLPNQKIEGNAA